MGATHLSHVPTSLLALVCTLAIGTDSLFCAWQDTATRDFSADWGTCELLLLVKWVTLGWTGHSRSRFTLSSVGMVHVLYFDVEDDTEERRISNGPGIGSSTSTITLAFTSLLAIPTRQTLTVGTGLDTQTWQVQVARNSCVYDGECVIIWR